MSGMWRRWAQRKRLVGVIYLGTAAIALAVAVLLVMVGISLPLTDTASKVTLGAVGAFAALSTVGLIVLAGYAFIDAHRYAKQVS